MLFFRQISALVFALGFLANTASAEPSGELIITVDEVDHRFELWKSQSDWSYSSNTYFSASIYAVPLSEESRAAFGAITLGFEVSDGEVQNPDMRLTQKLDGESVNRMTRSENGEFVIVLNENLIEGELLMMSGELTAILGRSDNYRDIDMSDPLPVSVVFDVTLGPVGGL